MEFGPITIRPHLVLEDVTASMRERPIDSVLVTTSDGRLVGTLHRRDAERRTGNL
jgi:CBS domain-containing protein